MDLDELFRIGRPAPSRLLSPVFWNLAAGLRLSFGQEPAQLRLPILQRDARRERIRRESGKLVHDLAHLFEDFGFLHASSVSPPDLGA